MMDIADMASQVGWAREGQLFVVNYLYYIVNYS
jgi:hypothetical protein